VRMRMDLWMLLVSLAIPTASMAGGTVGFGDIDPLLRRRPALRDFLLSSLELQSTVMAAVRLGPHFEHLSGARVGPYLLQGKPKGSKDAEPLEVVLCTHFRFLDADGKVAADETKATRIDEQLTVVMIREAHSKPAVPSCPE
jgi:Ran GTPase-activating protein (RanGAP) involved in mRNA processing and transport